MFRPKREGDRSEDCCAEASLLILSLLLALAGSRRASFSAFIPTTTNMQFEPTSAERSQCSGALQSVRSTGNLSAEMVAVPSTP